MPISRMIAGLMLMRGVSLAAITITGHVTDPQARAVPAASVSIISQTDSSVIRAVADADGAFTISVERPGVYELSAEASGFAPVGKMIAVESGPTTEDIQFSRILDQRASVTVIADVDQADVFHPDPAQRVLIRQETLDANPGRPGMPVSIPGMPAESPAGGIKPPQYFVPGVAGDHGEPIAQFFQVGGYLFPNNLPANAHGNGYADPNILIPIAIESVETDGGAFNVREGNDSVNAAMTFGLRDRLEPMVRVTADPRDVNLVAGWSPANPKERSWIGVELSYGNGFLERLEHRKQFKINASKLFTLGHHDLTIYGIGYYGFSYLPGLVPIGVRVPGDTIDPRQSEEASSGILIANDVWHLTADRQLQLSGYFRTYNLDVRPNFGDGLIRQSEFRTATSQSASYTDRLARNLSLIAGFEYRREAPRNLNLARFDQAAGTFLPATSNDLTINFYTPYASLDGSLTRFVHYNLGVRRDEITFDNLDLLRPDLSFRARQGISSPKTTVSLVPPGALFLPVVSLSYGEAFHIDDPRIGLTALRDHTVISPARAWQLVARKAIARTDLRVTLARVAVSQQLARIDNDTGLQEDVGPALVRSLTISARQHFRGGSLQALFAKADARDRLTGQPTPEAPRLIWDVLGTFDRLPFHLEARGEYEYVGRKPLGDGFNAAPVREFRGAISRSFQDGRQNVGVNFVIARGYAGQTLETLALPGEGEPFERITGFRLKSYATLSWTYRFGK